MINMNDEKPWSEPRLSSTLLSQESGPKKKFLNGICILIPSSVMHQSTHSSRVEWGGRGIQGIIFYGRMVRGGYFRYFYSNIDLTDLPSQAWIPVLTQIQSWQKEKKKFAIPLFPVKVGNTNISREIWEVKYKARSAHDNSTKRRDADMHTQ